jgi:predicted HTH transcriptional regulator
MFQEELSYHKYPEQIVLRNPGTSIVGRQQMLHGGESEPRNGNLMKMFNLIGYGEHAGSGVPDIYSVWRKYGFAEPYVDELFGGDQPDRTIVTLPMLEAEKYLDFFEKNGKVSDMGQEKQDEGPGNGQEKQDEGPGNGQEKQDEGPKKDQINITKEPTNHDEHIVSRQNNKNDPEFETRADRIIDLIRKNASITRTEMATCLGLSEKQVRTLLDYLKMKNKIHREGAKKGGKWIIS